MADTDNLGLLVLNPDSGPYLVDIVAIHGLNGHRIESWTYRNEETAEKVMWLRDMLPNRTTNARVMTFGYDSCSLEFGGAMTTDGLQEVATQLLEELLSKRSNDDIPVVFVCHSFGGVVAKMALWIANIDSRYLSIAGRTEHLVFFGTPHQATESSSWRDLLNDIALASTQKNLDKRKELLDSVGVDTVKDISERFYVFAEQYRIVSFYEMKTTGFESKDSVVVPAASAQLRLPREWCMKRNSDHMGICRFSRVDVESDDPAINVLCDRITNAMTTPIADYDREYILCRRTLSTLYPQLCLCKTVQPYPGTLGWLEEDAAFSYWLQNQVPAILHVYGQPGSGKSVLAAFLAMSLPQRRPIPNYMNLAVLSFRFDQFDSYRRSAKDLLFSFIRQLLLQRRSMYSHAYVQDLYKKMKLTSCWTIWNLWAMFQSMISLEEDIQVICIIDGFDECDSTGMQLLRYFIKLRQRTDSIFKLVVMSRPDPEICKLLGAFSVINLDIEPGVKADRELIIKEWVLTFLGESTTSQLLADKLATRLCSFDLTYWEIELTLGRLESPSLQSTAAAINLIERELEFPAEHFSLASIYERIFHEIEKATDTLEWSREVLSWLIYANQPLTLNQLASTVAVDNETESLVSLHKNIDTDIATTLKNTLGPLIKIEDGRVRFVHSTVRDFLIHRQANNNSFNFTDSGQWHLELATACLRYLYMDEFKEVALSLCAQFGSEGKGHLNLSPSPQMCYAFLPYAVQHWPAHCRYASSEEEEAESLVSKAISFLKDSPQIRWWSKFFMFLEDPLHTRGSMEDELAASVKAVQEVTATNVAADAAQITISEGGMVTWDGPPLNGYNPLYLASRLGLTAVVGSILKSGTCSTTDKLVALDISARNGHVGVVKELMDLNDPEVISRRLAALTKACFEGHELVAQQLLCYDADEKLDINSHLILAAKNGHESVVKLLIDSGASVETSHVVDEAKALHFAAAAGFDEVIEVLLHSKANIHAVNAAGFTPLHLAASEGHLAAVQTLLSNEKSDVETGTWAIKPLHMAAGGGHVSVIRELLKRKATLEAADSTGRTPLHWAAVSGCTEAAKELIDAGANISAADNKHWVPLHLAADYDHFGVVDVLLSKEADPDPIGTDRYRPLHLAAQSGYTQVVRRLLDSGAIEDPTTDTKNTPLHLASFNGHPETVRILIEYGSDVDRKRNDGWTSLHCSYGDFGVTKRLLESGASVFSMDAVGRQPLCLSAAAGSEPVVRLLLDAGADKNYLDRFGRRPLDVTLELPGKPVRLLLSQDGTDEPIGGPLTCNIIPGTKANVARTWSCNFCKRSIEDEFFYHCCECEDDDFDICTTCYNEGKRCRMDTHRLKARFLGDGMLSCSELSRWVGEMVLPKDQPAKAPSDIAKADGVEEWTLLWNVT